MGSLLICQFVLVLVCTSFHVARPVSIMYISVSGVALNHTHISHSLGWSDSQWLTTVQKE